MQLERPSDPSQPQITRVMRIVFEPDTPLSAVSETIRSLDLPTTAKCKSTLEFALAEVLLNALRASAGQGVEEPCVAEILDDGESVTVKLEDAAGGFDVKELPYDFSAEAEEVEVDAEALDRYRAKHDDRRFGLGLLLTRGIVDDFSLIFIDAAGREVPWQGKGSVHGTRVQFRLKHAKERADRRQSRRRRARASATIGGGLKAQVCDLSLEGARLVFVSRPIPQFDETYDVRITLAGKAPLETETGARVARIERIGTCYDVGVEFANVSQRILSNLRGMIERVEASTQPDALKKVHVELFNRKDGG